MKLLRGTIVNGRGEVSHWMKKMENYYVGKTGVKLFPGSNKEYKPTESVINDVQKDKGKTLE